MRWEKYILFSIGCLLSLFLRNTGYPSRDQWQQPERVMDAIGVKAGMIIGEAGAGRGYFTFKLSGWVGSTGKIYANEIDPHHLETIKQKCIERNIFNIETILGEEGDPLFPDGQLDMVIMVYVFHHLLSPTEFLQNIARDLKPGATVVLLEQDPQKTGSTHFLPRKQVLKLIDMANYKIVRILEFLEKDTIYILKPKIPTATAILRWESIIRR